MNRAEQIESRAADFLMRRGEPGWGVEDQTRLDAWLAESMAHTAAFWRLELGYSQLDRLTALNLPPHRKRLAGSWRLPLAASLALVAIGMGLLTLSQRFWGPEAPAPILYATAFGSIGQARLPDGSSVSLSSDTRIRFAQSAKQRTAWLERGEAYFEVAHDRVHPFVIHTQSHDIRVLGTKFSVDRSGAGLKVAVLEGRVQVDGGSTGISAGSVILISGQTAVANGRAFLIRSEDIHSLENGLSWRSGMVALDNVTISEAAAQFNRFHKRKLLVADPKVAGLRIGGTFRLSNLEGFANLLESAYGLQVKRSATEIIISSSPT